MWLWLRDCHVQACAFLWCCCWTLFRCSATSCCCAFSCSSSSASSASSSGPDFSGTAASSTCPTTSRTGHGEFRRRSMLTCFLVVVVVAVFFLKSAACTLAAAHSVRQWYTMAVWQLQPKVVLTVQQRVSCKFIWIRRTFNYIKLNVYYCVLFSRKVRIRIMVRSIFSVWMVSGYAHVCVLL